MMKSRSNPQLDKDLIKYLIKSVERKPLTTTLDGLHKYTMRLDDKVCKYMGQTKEDLKNFLKLFPHELYIDERERVYLSKNNQLLTSENKGSNNEKKDKPDKSITDGPISQATGSIYRILGKYGFIELHPPHAGKVYFDGRHVENGQHMFLIDYGYKEGMRVQLDAVPGPENAEASYRAKHVQKLSSSENSPIDGNISKSGTTVLMMMDQVGKIAQVFDQYGFISRTANKIDDVFFFMNTIVLCDGKQISAPLTDFINPGMEVKFDARPNHRQDAQNNWYATRVWVPGISSNVDKNLLNLENSAIDDTQQEIYISDDEEDESSEENQRTHPSFISNEKGYLNVIDDTKGHILFGKNYKQRALYVSDVVRVDGKMVEDQAWRFEGGHDVNFNARTMCVKSDRGISEVRLIATLIWIGLKPDVVEMDLFDLYSLYAVRHKVIISNPVISNEFYIDKSETKPSNIDKMDLIDEFKIRNISDYHDDEPLNIPIQRTSLLDDFNLYDDQWNSNENGSNLPNNRVFLPSPPAHSFDNFPPFTEDSAWNPLYPISNHSKSWDDILFDKGVSSLNLIDSFSQTENKSKVQSSSIGCQASKPSFVNDSTQTIKTITKDKGVSTHDMKIFSSHSSDFIPVKMISNGCQTDDSIHKINYADQINGDIPSNGKEEIFHLCPNCHYIY